MLNKLNKIYSKYKIKYSHIGSAREENDFGQYLNNILFVLFDKLLSTIYNDEDLKKILIDQTNDMNLSKIYDIGVMRYNFDKIIKFYSDKIENDFIRKEDIKREDAEKFRDLINKYSNWDERIKEDALQKIYDSNHNNILNYHNRRYLLNSKLKQNNDKNNLYKDYNEKLEGIKDRFRKKLQTFNEIPSIEDYKIIINRINYFNLIDEESFKIEDFNNLLGAVSENLNNFEDIKNESNKNSIQKIILFFIKNFKKKLNKSNKKKNLIKAVSESYFKLLENLSKIFDIDDKIFYKNLEPILDITMFYDSLFDNKSRKEKLEKAELLELLNLLYHFNNYNILHSPKNFSNFKYFFLDKLNQLYNNNNNKKDFINNFMHLDYAIIYKIKKLFNNQHYPLITEIINSFDDKFQHELESIKTNIQNKNTKKININKFLTDAVSNINKQDSFTFDIFLEIYGYYNEDIDFKKILRILNRFYLKYCNYDDYSPDDDDDDNDKNDNNNDDDNDEDDDDNDADNDDDDDDNDDDDTDGTDDDDTDNNEEHKSNPLNKSNQSKKSLESFKVNHKDKSQISKGTKKKTRAAHRIKPKKKSTVGVVVNQNDDEELDKFIIFFNLLTHSHLDKLLDIKKFIEIYRKLIKNMIENLNDKYIENIKSLIGRLEEIDKDIGILFLDKSDLLRFFHIDYRKNKRKIKNYQNISFNNLSLYNINQFFYKSSESNESKLRKILKKIFNDQIDDINNNEIDFILDNCLIDNHSTIENYLKKNSYKVNLTKNINIYDELFRLYSELIDKNIYFFIKFNDKRPKNNNINRYFDNKKQIIKRKIDTLSSKKNNKILTNSSRPLNNEDNIDLKSLFNLIKNISKDQYNINNIYNSIRDLSFKNLGDDDYSSDDDDDDNDDNDNNNEKNNNEDDDNSPYDDDDDNDDNDNNNEINNNEDNDIKNFNITSNLPNLELYSYIFEGNKLFFPILELLGYFYNSVVSKLHFENHNLDLKYFFLVLEKFNNLYKILDISKSNLNLEIKKSYNENINTQKDHLMSLKSKKNKLINYDIFVYFYEILDKFEQFYDIGNDIDSITNSNFNLMNRIEYLKKFLDDIQKKKIKIQNSNIFKNILSLLFEIANYSDENNDTSNSKNKLEYNFFFIEKSQILKLYKLLEMRIHKKNLGIKFKRILFWGVNYYANDFKFNEIITILNGFNKMNLAKEFLIPIPILENIRNYLIHNRDNINETIFSDAAFLFQIISELEYSESDSNDLNSYDEDAKTIHSELEYSELDSKDLKKYDEYAKTIHNSELDNIIILLIKILNINFSKMHPNKIYYEEINNNYDNEDLTMSSTSNFQNDFSKMSKEINNNDDDNKGLTTSSKSTINFQDDSFLTDPEIYVALVDNSIEMSSNTIGQSNYDQSYSFDKKKKMVIYQQIANAISILSLKYDKKFNTYNHFNDLKDKISTYIVKDSNPSNYQKILYKIFCNYMKKFEDVEISSEEVVGIGEIKNYSIDIYIKFKNVQIALEVNGTSHFIPELNKTSNTIPELKNEIDQQTSSSYKPINKNSKDSNCENEIDMLFNDFKDKLENMKYNERNNQEKRIYEKNTSNIVDNKNKIEYKKFNFENNDRLKFEQFNERTKKKKKILERLGYIYLDFNIYKLSKENYFKYDARKVIIFLIEELYSIIDNNNIQSINKSDLCELIKIFIDAGDFKKKSDTSSITTSSSSNTRSNTSSSKGNSKGRSKGRNEGRKKR